MKIAFYCVKPADEGGETPIVDSRRVFDRIDPALREKFRQKKVMYVRNYGEGLDIRWQEVFNTEELSVVEEFCRGEGIEYEWGHNGRLRTRQICQAIAKHPVTGVDVWFNQAHLFHVSSLEPEVRAGLLQIFREEELPRNVYYGDGTPIEESELHAVREAYRRESFFFPWCEGDILLLDNMLMGHGRNPFKGERRIVVGMAEACHDPGN
jgi:alpha-ketoglutarate-dependent taurine dioxygenase